MNHTTNSPEPVDSLASANTSLQPPVSEIPAAPAPAPEKKVRFKKFVLPVSCLVAGLVFGSATAAASKPEPVVQTVEKVVEKRVEVPVEKTPKACITALDLAGDAMGTLSKVGNLGSRGIQAAYARNGSDLDQVNEDLKTLRTELNGQTPALGVAVSACRAAE